MYTSCQVYIMTRLGNIIQGTTKEAAFSEYENNPSRLESLKSEYLEIIERLDHLVEDGRLPDFAQL